LFFQRTAGDLAPEDPEACLIGALQMKSFRTPFAIILSLGCGAALLPGSAIATEGYFQYGYGARQKALGGAGVADSRDATAAALNPAGLVNVEDQLNASLSVFRVFRGFDGSGADGLTPNGAVGSDRPYFFIPNLAWSQRLSNNPFADVMAVTLYVNGGLNTEYRGRSGSQTCQALVALGAEGDGVFCNGTAGANLVQAFLSTAFAKQFGSVSVGIAPIFAVQSIDFDGLQLFGDFSVAPGNVSDHGYDWSFGGGVRAGIEIKATDNIRLGIAGNSRIWMSDFDSYRGLLAEGGGFDIPPTLQAGIAVDVHPRLTLMLDYKRIWYSVIKSINNPSTNLLTGKMLGASDGPGFGWQDIDIIKFGAEWRAMQKLTLRAGYAYNEGTFSSRDVEVNILAPGIVRHHFTGGLSYELSREWDFELAGYYSPQEKVAGPELGVPPGNPAHIIEIQGQGGEVTFGLTYRFGAIVPTLK
jgi:long-chain fatty acid transport protein